MSDNFCSARLDSTIINKYRLKQLKNEYARDIAIMYKKNTDKSDLELKTAANKYYIVRQGSLDIYLADKNLEKMTPEIIDSFFSEIKEGVSKNFIRFYRSYENKIQLGYNQEFIDNAYEDLKTAYVTYRAIKNPQLDLDENRITKNEMVNLFYILSNQQNNNYCANKSENDYENSK